MDAGRLSTAGTNTGNRIHHREAASVQIFFHVGNDHVSFAYQNPISSHQFQILNKGQVVQTGPADLTAIDFHRRKHCYRSNLSSSARRPFDVLQQALMQVIFKLIGQTVLIVMSGAAAALGIGDVVKRNHDTVNGDIFVSGILPQLINTGFHIFQCQFLLCDQILAGLEPQRTQFPQLI